jgi:hypothetical protein
LAITNLDTLRRTPGVVVVALEREHDSLPQLFGVQMPDGGRRLIANGLISGGRVFVQMCDARNVRLLFFTGQLEQWLDGRAGGHVHIKTSVLRLAAAGPG